MSFGTLHFQFTKGEKEQSTSPYVCLSELPSSMDLQTLGSILEKYVRWQRGRMLPKADITSKRAAIIKFGSVDEA